MIAGIVTVFVVQAFEVIQIGEDEGIRCAASKCPDCRLERAPVGKTSETVSPGLHLGSLEGADRANPGASEDTQGRQLADDSRRRGLVYRRRGMQDTQRPTHESQGYTHRRNRSTWAIPQARARVQRIGAFEDNG